MQHVDSIHIDVSGSCSIRSVSLEVGSSSITGSIGKLKFSWGLSLRGHAHAQKTTIIINNNNKKTRLKLMPPVLEATLLNATCAHIILTDEIFKWLSKSELFSECQFGIRAPILNLNRFRFRAEWSHLPHVHQRRPEMSVCVFLK